PADDDWIHGQITSRDTTITCGGQAAQRITVPQVATAASSAFDTVRVGSNVRSYVYYTYGVYTFDGEKYLGGREPAGSTDTLGATATTAVNIAQIGLKLRTVTDVRGPKGSLVADSVTTRIYVRN